MNKDLRFDNIQFPKVIQQRDRAKNFTAINQISHKSKCHLENMKTKWSTNMHQPNRSAASPDTIYAPWMRTDHLQPGSAYSLVSNHARNRRARLPQSSEMRMPNRENAENGSSDKLDLSQFGINSEFPNKQITFDEQGNVLLKKANLKKDKLRTFQLQTQIKPEFLENGDCSDGKHSREIQNIRSFFREHTLEPQRNAGVTDEIQSNHSDHYHFESAQARERAATSDPTAIGKDKASGSDNKPALKFAKKGDRAELYPLPTNKVNMINTFPKSIQKLDKKPNLTKSPQKLKMSQEKFMKNSKTNFGKTFELKSSDTGDQPIRSFTNMEFSVLSTKHDGVLLLPDSPRKLNNSFHSDRSQKVQNNLKIKEAIREFNNFKSITKRKKRISNEARFNFGAQRQSRSLSSCQTWQSVPFNNLAPFSSNGIKFGKNFLTRSKEVRKNQLEMLGQYQKLYSIKHLGPSHQHHSFNAEIQKDGILPQGDLSIFEIQEYATIGHSQNVNIENGEDNEQGQSLGNAMAIPKLQSKQSLTCKHASQVIRPLKQEPPTKVIKSNIVRHMPLENKKFIGISSSKVSISPPDSQCSSSVLTTQKYESKYRTVIYKTSNGDSKLKHSDSGIKTRTLSKKGSSAQELNLTNNNHLADTYEEGAEEEWPADSKLQAFAPFRINAQSSKVLNIDIPVDEEFDSRSNKGSHQGFRINTQMLQKTQMLQDLITTRSVDSQQRRMASGKQLSQANADTRLLTEVFEQDSSQQCIQISPESLTKAQKVGVASKNAAVPQYIELVVDAARAAQQTIDQVIQALDSERVEQRHSIMSKYGFAAIGFRSPQKLKQSGKKSQRIAATSKDLARAVDPSTALPGGSSSAKKPAPKASKSESRFKSISQLQSAQQQFDSYESYLSFEQKMAQLRTILQNTKSGERPGADLASAKQHLCHENSAQTNRNQYRNQTLQQQQMASIDNSPLPPICGKLIKLTPKIDQHKQFHSIDFDCRLRGNHTMMLPQISFNSQVRLHDKLIYPAAVPQYLNGGQGPPDSRIVSNLTNKTARELEMPKPDIKNAACGREHVLQKEGSSAPSARKEGMQNQKITPSAREKENHMEQKDKALKVFKSQSLDQMSAEDDGQIIEVAKLGLNSSESRLKPWRQEGQESATQKSFDRQSRESSKLMIKSTEFKKLEQELGIDFQNQEKSAEDQLQMEKGGEQEPSVESSPQKRREALQPQQQRSQQVIQLQMQKDKSTGGAQALQAQRPQTQGGARQATRKIQLNSNDFTSHQDTVNMPSGRSANSKSVLKTKRSRIQSVRKLEIQGQIKDLQTKVVKQLILNKPAQQQTSRISSNTSLSNLQISKYLANNQPQNLQIPTTFQQTEANFKTAQNFETRPNFDQFSLLRSSMGFNTSAQLQIQSFSKLNTMSKIPLKQPQKAKSKQSKNTSIPMTKSLCKHNSHYTENLENTLNWAKRPENQQTLSQSRIKSEIKMIHKIQNIPFIQSNVKKAVQSSIKIPGSPNHRGRLKTRDMVNIKVYPTSSFQAFTKVELRDIKSQNHYKDGGEFLRRLISPEPKNQLAAEDSPKRLSIINIGSSLSDYDKTQRILLQPQKRNNQAETQQSYENSSRGQDFFAFGKRDSYNAEKSTERVKSDNKRVEERTRSNMQFINLDMNFPSADYANQGHQQHDAGTVENTMAAATASGTDVSR